MVWPSKNITMKQSINKECFLGIDLGTSQVKVIIVNLEGNIVGKSSAGYPTYASKPGYAEQDPHKWWESTIQAVRSAVPSAEIEACWIKAIGLSGQTHGTVLLDNNFNYLRNTITWMDQRSSYETKILENTVGKKISRISGLPIATGFMAPILLWIKKNEPKLWEKIYKFILPKDYIRMRLTGVVATDVTDAGGTLLLNVRDRQWSEKIFELLEIPLSIAPPIFESYEVTGRVKKEVALMLGIAPETPVCAGGADHIMAAIGNNLIEMQEAVSIIGTGALIMTPIDIFKIDPHKGLHLFPYVMRDKWILMGAILCGGLCLNWFRQLLSGKISNIEGNFYELVDKECLEVPPVPNGLIFLPYLRGERTPHMDPWARGAFVGLTDEHSAIDLARSMMEGVTFALRDCLETFKKNGVNINSLRISGGGAKSMLWRQMQADILNLPVISVSTEEGSAYGAAIMAAASSKKLGSIKEICNKWIKVRGRLLPIEQNVKIYDRAFKIYRDLYNSLKKHFHAISLVHEN